MNKKLIAILQKNFDPEWWDGDIFQSQNQIKELHSRITSNQKELLERMTKQHREAEVEIRRLREDVVNRIGVLEKWKYLVIGGAIVVGFIVQAYMKHFM